MRFRIIDTCKIIMNNHTCEIIDLIVVEKSINHSILYNNFILNYYYIELYRINFIIIFIIIIIILNYSDIKLYLY